ncbi:MAG: hypothetical protein ACKO0M_01085 [Cyanobium sp.]
MIVLKITNASEVMASKLGKFFESLTPDSFDQTMVEDEVIKALIDNLSREGIKGEVAAVRGVDLRDRDLVLQDRSHVRSLQSF